MDFITYKLENKRLNDLTKSLSSQIDTMDWRNESVRSSEDFKEIKGKFNKAFSELQLLNNKGKKFQSELKRERRASW